MQLCQSAVPGLTDFLQVAQTWDRAPLSGVFSTLFAVIIVEKKHLLQKVRAGSENTNVGLAGNVNEQLLVYF